MFKVRHLRSFENASWFGLSPHHVTDLYSCVLTSKCTRSPSLLRDRRLKRYRVPEQNSRLLSSQCCSRRPALKIRLLHATLVFERLTHPSSMLLRKANSRHASNGGNDVFSESQRPASKRRKRKTSTATTGAGSKKKNMSPGPPQPFMGGPPGGPGSQGYVLNLANKAEKNEASFIFQPQPEDERNGD